MTMLRGNTAKSIM